jgi:hypothetical protein
MLYNYCDIDQTSLLTSYKISYILRIHIKKYVMYFENKKIKCLLFNFIILNIPMKSKNILFSYLNSSSLTYKKIYI